jgi:hypothetical protein
LGSLAGEDIRGDNNIDIGNHGNFDDSDTIRISYSQNAVFIAGIYNATVIGSPVYRWIGRPFFLFHMLFFSDYLPALRFTTTMQAAGKNAEQRMMESTEIDSRGRSHISRETWLLFCLVIVAVKFAVFALDPLPKFWGGDSKSYLLTAISGWIPEDRSFLYGFVIRWVALSTSSLTSLLVLQVFASANIALVCGWICLRIFKLPPWSAFAAGLLCCLDPLQLYWERAVMTETLSLLLYVLLLQRSFVYLRKKRIRELIWIQLIGILAISFRISYLLLVYAVTVALPILAFALANDSASEERGADGHVKRLAFARLMRLGGHILLSLAMLVLSHGAYRRINGALSHREPKYLYVTGIDLLTFWAPVLQPSDAADPRLGELIRNGGEFKINDIHYRVPQLHLKGFLIDRLRQIEPDRARQDRLARQTALHALRRDPLAILNLAWQTYADFWRIGVRNWAELEVPSKGSFSEKEIAELGLVNRFHQVVTLVGVPQPITFTGWYYLVMSWYYYVLLLSPAILAVVILLSRRKSPEITFLVLNMVVLFISILVFAGRPEIRYLHPISILTLLTFAAAAGLFLERNHDPRRKLPASSLCARSSSSLPHP